MKKVCTMRRWALAASIALVGVASSAGEASRRAAVDPGAFLEALAGTWTVATEAIPGIDLEPVRSESRQEARLLGGRWLVAESTGLTPGGQPHTSIFTLGYDPARQRFIGTWIDSMQTHLWEYTGTLDAAGVALTLETEGPILGDATRLTSYRKIIEIRGRDEVVVRTSILGPDGEWFEFAIAEQRRAG